MVFGFYEVQKMPTTSGISIKPPLRKKEIRFCLVFIISICIFGCQLVYSIVHYIAFRPTFRPRAQKSERAHFIAFDAENPSYFRYLHVLCILLIVLVAASIH